jgi:hypothetical protein
LKLKIKNYTLNYFLNQNKKFSGLDFQEGSAPSTDGSRSDLTRVAKSADMYSAAAAKTARRPSKTATLVQVHRPASSNSSGSRSGAVEAATSPQPLIYSSMKYSFLGM